MKNIDGIELLEKSAHLILELCQLVRDCDESKPEDVFALMQKGIELDRVNLELNPGAKSAFLHMLRFLSSEAKE